MSFALPMIRREPTNRLIDCYFCIVPPLRQGITKKKKKEEEEEEEEEDCQLS